MGTRTYSRRSSTGEIKLTRLGRERAARTGGAGAGINSAEAAVENAQQVNEYLSGGQLPPLEEIENESRQVVNRIMREIPRRPMQSGEDSYYEAQAESVLTKSVDDEINAIIDDDGNINNPKFTDFSRRWSQEGSVQGKSLGGGLNVTIQHKSAPQTEITNFALNMSRYKKLLKTAKQTGSPSQVQALNDLIRYQTTLFVALVNRENVDTIYLPRTGPLRNYTDV